jgi:hypothetical protein
MPIQTNDATTACFHNPSVLFFTFEPAGPKRDQVTGGWRKLHNEEHRNLYSSPSIIRKIKSRWMRWAGHVAWIEKRNAYRWLANIKMDLREMGWCRLD